MNQPNQLIWEYVKDLLHIHDCVIVPGFGGFVCNKEAARIDQVSHVITPPSRKVVFNQNLKSNDGLLAGFWSQKQQVSYSQAVLVINDCVRSIQTILQDKKLLSIDLFGSFRLNAEANYVFLPDKRNNYLTSSFGLSSLVAQPVTSRKARVAKPRVFTSHKPQAMKQKKNILPAILITTMVLVLSVNGFIFLNDNNFAADWKNKQTMSITSWFDSLFNNRPKPQEQVVVTPIPETVIDTFTPPAPAVVEPEVITAQAPAEQPSIPTVVEAAPAKTNTEVKTELDIYAPYYAFATHYQAARASLYIPQHPLDITENTMPEVAVPMQTVTEPTDAISTANSDVKAAIGYYVIGGVFCKERNAKRFIKELNEKGFTEAELLVNTKINCKRVSYKKFTSKQQAEVFCIHIQGETNPDAWILAVK